MQLKHQYIDMQLHTLKREHAHKNKRPRVGRGGKRGTTAGKGTKGQKARSGHRIRPAMREFIQRLPKLRGYANKPIVAAPSVVNVGQLARVKAATVNRAALIEAGLIRSSAGAIKVLGTGEIAKAVTVEGLAVSASAKAKIEKAGGKVS